MSREQWWKKVGGGGGRRKSVWRSEVQDRTGGQSGSGSEGSAGGIKRQRMVDRGRQTENNDVHDLWDLVPRQDRFH
ncbi:hypothetical protein BaRGS_00036085 [Batillaria attramentaria]|uniref:Uncharacterized protein n=1 Tax=Batillaria attramentaria TaxID=370345 RepID=A0ABD0JD07_9CAEN